MDRLNRLIEQVKKIRKGRNGAVFVIEWDGERGVWIVNREKEFPTEEAAAAYAALDALGDDPIIVINDADYIRLEEPEQLPDQPDQKQQEPPEQLPDPEEQEIYQVEKRGVSFICSGKWFRSMAEVKGYINNITKTGSYSIMVRNEKDTFEDRYSSGSPPDTN